MDENKIQGEKPDLGILIPLKEAAVHSGLSHSHLRKLVREGKIAGRRLGRDWFTSHQAVQKYLSRDRRPGPKPKKRPDPKN